jgi:hypothetical protein
MSVNRTNLCASTDPLNRSTIADAVVAVARGLQMRVATICFLAIACTAWGQSKITQIDYPGAAGTKVRYVAGQSNMCGYFVTSAGATHGFTARPGSTGQLIFKQYDFPNAAATKVNGCVFSNPLTLVGEFIDANNVTHAFSFSGGKYVRYDFLNATYTAFESINGTYVISGSYVDTNKAQHGFIIVP